MRSLPSAYSYRVDAKDSYEFDQFSCKLYNEICFEIEISEYAKGRTPNGDMLCNQKIKFDVFMKFAHASLAADAVATGHYVRSTAGAFLERLDDQPVDVTSHWSNVSKGKNEDFDSGSYGSPSSTSPTSPSPTSPFPTLLILSSFSPPSLLLLSSSSASDKIVERI